MKRFGYIPEFPILATAPSTPTTGFNRPYYDTTLNCLMNYDESRSKWLSAESFTLCASRSGNTGAGVSLQSSGSVPTSTSPFHLGPRNTCLVAVSITTGNTEDFTLGVSDISTGGSATAYTLAIPSGIDYSVDNVNQNFTANDTIDIFVSAVGGSGNINNLVVLLTFRKRA